MENTETLFSEREYLQRLLVEGVREGEFISDTPALRQYRATDTTGDIGSVSKTLTFLQPDGSVVGEEYDWSADILDIACRFSISEVEELLATRYKNWILEGVG